MRVGSWKGVRKKRELPLELYCLDCDLGEQHDLADQHPEVVADLERLLLTARTDSPDWPVR